MEISQCPHSGTDIRLLPPLVHFAFLFPMTLPSSPFLFLLHSSLLPGCLLGSPISFNGPIMAAENYQRSLSNGLLWLTLVTLYGTDFLAYKDLHMHCFVYAQQCCDMSRMLLPLTHTPDYFLNEKTTTTTENPQEGVLAQHYIANKGQSRDQTLVFWLKASAF